VYKFISVHGGNIRTVFAGDIRGRISTCCFWPA